MFRVLFVLMSLYGHPPALFNSEAECKKAMDSTGDKCVKVNYPHTLWVYGGGGHWYASDPAITLAQCVDARDHFHLRGPAMQEQAQDKNWRKHQPFCLPTGTPLPGRLIVDQSQGSAGHRQTRPVQN
mgnify:CR=1 FL=1